MSHFRAAGDRRVDNDNLTLLTYGSARLLNALRHPVQDRRVHVGFEVSQRLLVAKHDICKCFARHMAACVEDFRPESIPQRGLNIRGFEDLVRQAVTIDVLGSQVSQESDNG